MPLHSLLSRLDALLLVLKTCKASACTHPWKVLHPAGDVENLYDALEPRFNDFYEIEQEKVQFTRCEKGYIAESEGPHKVKPYDVAEIGPRGGRLWSDLV